MANIRKGKKRCVTAAFPIRTNAERMVIEKGGFT